MIFYYGDGKFEGEIIDVPLTYDLDISPFDTYKESVSTVSFDESFARCTNITSMKNWFKGFSDLTNIYGTKNLNTSVVTDMSGMFMNCSSLVNIEVDSETGLNTFDLTNFNTDSVTNMMNMFCGVSSATVIDASTFNTGKCKDFTYMFNECSNLTTIMTSKLFVVNDGGKPYTMFANDSKLVGGAGSK